MRSVETAFEARTKYLRGVFAGALAMRHASPLIEFLRMGRESTMTVFEHLRQWWS